MPKFHVEETVSIKAPLDKVRGIVGDFRRWTPWSPWVSAEPDCPLSFAEDGKSYSWDGKIIGSGNMKIASETDRRIDYKLEFLKPFKSKADVAFTFTFKEGKTHVTWLLDSALPFFMFFMSNSVKAAIGADYRRGLVQLKDYAELDEVPSKNEFVGVGDGIECAYVGLRSSCKTDQLGADMSPKYEQLKQWAEQSSAAAIAPPVAIYHKFDMVKGVAEYTAALPIKEPPTESPQGFYVGKLKAPKTYKIKHTGPYRHLGSGWSAGMMRQRAKVFRAAKGAPFEQYISDPQNTPEKELVTEIHFPAR